MGCLVRLLLVVLVLVGIGLGLTAWGYSSVDIDFGGITGIRPEFKMDFQTVASAAAALLLDGWIGAASQFVEGVTIEGEVNVENHSFVPLYIPALEHELSIGGELVGSSPLETPSMWLGPRETKSVPVEMTVPLGDVPRVVVEYVYSGGNLDIDIESTIRVGTFSFSKVSTVTTGVANPVGSSSSSAAATFSMDEYGFSPGTATLGDTVTASVTVSGGDAGQYTVRLRKDIALWPDETVGEFFFNHDGSTTTATNPFTPSDSGTYHMDIQYEGETLWSQPDDASRLTVSSAAATFSMTSYGFSPGTATLGDTVTASVTVSGGDAGQYTVCFWKDISLWPDEKVGEFSFHHDGGTTTATNPFTPSDSSTYHMDIQYEGETLWSQPDDVSRLTVSD